MTKSAIFFCLLIASVYGASIPADRAGFFDTLVEKANGYKDEILKVVEDGVKFVEQKVEEAKNTASTTFEELKQKALSVTDDVTNEVNNAIRQIDQTIDELTGQAPGVDVTECTEMAKEIHDTASHIVSDVSTCVTDKIDEAKYRVDNIGTISQNLLKDLQAIGEKTAQCTKNGEGTMSIVGCLGGALKDAYDVAYNQAPVVLEEVIHIADLIRTAMPSVTQCTLSSSVPTFRDSVDKIAPTVEACIKRKIEDAKQAA